MQKGCIFWGMQVFIGGSFSKLPKPLTNLSPKDVPYYFYEECVLTYENLRDALITTPIIQPPKWDEPFEIMCDASNYAIGYVLGQWDGKKA